MGNPGLNNDAALFPGALQALQKEALSSETISITVPQQVLAAKNRSISVHCPSADSTHECDVSISVHHDNALHIEAFHDGDRVDMKFANFFCVYIKREAWDELSGLDAEFGRHYRSDQIFCGLVRSLLHKRIVYTPRAVVLHEHQAATNELREQTDFELMFKKNQWPEFLKVKTGYRTALWDSE